MNLIRAVVHNPVKVTVGVLLVALFGAVALLRMPLQLTPEVQRPTISVQTRWPGASPQEVEREIIIEQEEQLKSVEGLVKLSSEATDSQGTVKLEFHVGTDLEGALLKVNARLQQVREYPEEADQPVISTSNSSDRPIAWFILSTRMPTDEQIVEFQNNNPDLVDKLDLVRKSHNVGLAMLRLRLLAKEHAKIGKMLLPHEGINVTKLRRYAEDEIEARFERIPGVSQSNVLGGLQDEMQVLVSPEELAARQITIEDLRRVLRAQNQDTSAGDFWEGKRRWVVRTLGQFRSPDDVGNQLIAVRDGVPVYVRDVAEISLGYRKPDGIVRRFGESSIAVNCIRETGANVLDVMDGLRKMRTEIDEQILKPKGLQLIQVYDETEYIYSALDLVQQNIFIGGALTMIVLMLFLHLGIRTLAVIPLIIGSALAAAYVSSWFFLVCLALLIGIGFWAARGALVVGLAIPTSIIGTFLILGLLGRSLNVVSLAGMAFAVGMLVDNAVVVLENVYRRFSLGEAPFDAAINGTAEVSGAVVASTLTTIAVFLPVVFVQEEAGQLFQDIALAITGAVGLSLIVSMTLISTASARLLHRDDATASGSTRPSTAGLGYVAGKLNSVSANFVSAIVNFNQWVQSSTFLRLAITVGLVGFSIAGSWTFWPRVEYLPNGNRNLIFAILLPPPGYNLNQLMELGQTVEANLRPYWDAVPGSEEAAQLDGPVIGDFFFVARGRSVFMGLSAYEEERAAEIIPLIQRATSQLPGTYGVASQSSLFAGGLESGRTIDIEITGPDLQKLVGLGGQIFGQVRELLPPTTQSRPIPSLDLSSPEVHIEPHLIQAAEMGMSANELGYTANALIDGAYAGDYFIGGDKIDLTIKGRDDTVRNAQDVEALPISTPMGQTIPLGALAKVTMKSGPEQINHRERQRAITIQVTPPPEMPLEEAMIKIRDEIVRPIQNSGQLDGGYRIELAGTADKLNATWQALQFNVLLALLITYLLMAALFESWLYPLVIILSVPLGAVGGVVGLQLLNQFVLQPLDVLTMLGFVILIGTVVNNPILIVHQSLNLIREQNLAPNQAILESVRTRVRPIFMTTMTTVLGLLPLVLFPGAGSELYRGLGSVVLGGLIISTIFTLVLVPTLFSLALDAKQLATRTIWKTVREPGSS